MIKGVILTFGDVQVRIQDGVGNVIDEKLSIQLEGQEVCIGMLISWLGYLWIINYVFQSYEVRALRLSCYRSDTTHKALHL